MSLVVAWLVRESAQPAWASISAASTVAFTMSFVQLLAAALVLGNSLLEVSESALLLERVGPILTTPVETSGRAVLGCDPVRLRGSIEVKNVTFRYGEGSRPVLDDVSFRIEAGQCVAIVGASGSGKSTLLRLLLGFETPESGSVSYDGRILSTLDLTSIRRHIGAVLQDGRVLAGDIASNIIGSSGLGLEAAWEAAKIAALDDDIRAMPMGMHTKLTDGGGTLSGGQRQRILIARALIRGPAIVFFDEATSALDNRTQAVVSASLQSIAATKILIAHRLSTIQGANHILVLHEGRIVEQGQYDELLERRGAFFELAQRQIA
jgi:ABC-type bacteriocin/lantibiotic exporter with double-glycine peptidase domain